MASLIQQDVLKLQIPMNDAQLVDVVEGKAEFAEDLPGLGICESALFDEVVVEFTAGAELCDEPYCVLCGDDFVELSDVWVMETTVMMYLPGEGCGHGFGYLLDGDPCG
jgi:hypothetical protein